MLNLGLITNLELGPIVIFFVFIRASFGAKKSLDGAKKKTNI
jgi:hypothetical protein